MELHLGLALFLLGLALVAVELSYPRRYVGVLGLAATLVGLVAMFLPEDLPWQSTSLILLAAAVGATAIALPFYRRLAPHVPIPTNPHLRPGDTGRVIEAIRLGRDGLVQVQGIAWSAQAAQDVPAGALVRVLEVQEARLVVEPVLGPAPQQRDADQDAHHHQQR